MGTDPGRRSLTQLNVSRGDTHHLVDVATFATEIRLHVNHNKHLQDAQPHRLSDARATIQCEMFHTWYSPHARADRVLGAQIPVVRPGIRPRVHGWLPISRLGAVQLGLGAPSG